MGFLDVFFGYLLGRDSGRAEAKADAAVRALQRPTTDRTSCANLHVGNQRDPKIQTTIQSLGRQFDSALLREPREFIDLGTAYESIGDNASAERVFDSMAQRMKSYAGDPTRASKEWIHDMLCCAVVRRAGTRLYQAKFEQALEDCEWVIANRDRNSLDGQTQFEQASMMAIRARQRQMFADGS